MERRLLGRSGIEVPAIGMGTWRTFDTTEDVRWLVEEALAAGIDLFDSSPMYDRAEDALARALAGDRDRVVIATKVWSEDPGEGRRQAEHALGLYGTIDIYQVHNLANVPAQLALVEELKAEGKVRAVGATHHREARFEELAELMRSGRVDMVQIPYNPLRREAERLLLPLAAELGIGVLVMSPLKGDVLDRTPSLLERAPSAEVLAELGVETWPQAILKWIASDPRVSTVLTATHRPGRAASNARGGEPPMFTEEQRALVGRICASG